MEKKKTGDSNCAKISKNMLFLYIFFFYLLIVLITYTQFLQSTKK